MRVAVISERVQPHRGGAETYVADLCRILVRRGHDVTLVANDWDLHALDPTVSRVRLLLAGARRGSRIWNFATEAERWVETNGPGFDITLGFINTWAHDVIIPQGGVRAASLEANALRFESGPVRWLYRLTKQANPKYEQYRKIESRQYDPRRRAHVVAPSAWVAGHLEHYHQVPLDRIRVIHNAIDAGRLAIDDKAHVRGRLRAQLGIAENDLLALFVGHNFRLKGLPPLLRALAVRTLRGTSTRPIHLLVCGKGSQPPMRRLARKLGLEAVVHFAGFLDDVRQAYAASDFFVLPTYYDPCSLVVFEALACGLPVITTSQNGAAEVMTQGREGFVVPHPDDRKALSGALDALTDPEARARMSAAASLLGQEQSFDRHVDRLLALFEDIVREKRALAQLGTLAG
jgi:UDP-glucose:(heptosyl)LPS alpha-1,3-glucosyltransferase